MRGGEGRAGSRAHLHPQGPEKLARDGVVSPSTRCLRTCPGHQLKTLGPTRKRGARVHTPTHRPSQRHLSVSFRAVTTHLTFPEPPTGWESGEGGGGGAHEGGGGRCRVCRWFCEDPRILLRAVGVLRPDWAQIRDTPSVPATSPSTATGAGTAELAGCGVLAQGRSGCCMPRLAGEDQAGQVGSSEPPIFGCWARTAKGLHLAITVGRPFPSRDQRGPL